MIENQIYLIKIFILILVIGISIGIEFGYRDSLFEKTLEFAENWQISSPNSKGFWNFASVTGTAPIMIPMLIICFLWLPLNKSFTFLSVLIYSYYFDNIMKVMYGNPRPFWVKPILFISCNGGFGNPSGHSFSSSSVYLAFWHLLTDFEVFKKNKIGILSRILLLILTLIWVVIIIMSRIYLGAHSINQVLYGANCGLILYFTIFFILQWHIKTGIQFSEIFKNKISIIIYSIWYSLLLILGILSCTLIDNKQYLYEDTLEVLCPGTNTYRKFNENGLFGTFSVFGVIGGHYGLIVFYYMIEKKYPNKSEEINYWNKGSFMTHLLRMVMCIVLGLPLILTFVISGSSSLGIIYIFKVILPYLVAIFNINSIGVYYCIVYKQANPEIYIDPSKIIVIKQLEIENSHLRDSQDRERDISNVNILKS